MKDDRPNCTLESSPVMSWFLIVAFSLLLPIPFAVIAMMFEHLIGPTFTAVLWLGMCLAFPIWAYWLFTLPFDEDRQ
jgi:hypothetical protein